MIRTWTPRNRQKWARRICRDLGLGRPNSVQREMLRHLAEVQRAIDTLSADADIDTRLQLQRAYGSIVDRLRKLRR